MNVKRTPRGVPLKAKILSGVCIAALLYGTVAQAMSDVGTLGEERAQGTHPIHKDLVSKQYTYDANGNHVGTTHRRRGMRARSMTFSDV